MSQAKEAKKGPKVDLIKSFVKEVKGGGKVLILPEAKALKFVKTFLRRVNACNDNYAEKFMRMAFGLQEFNVELEVMVPATTHVRVVAKTKEAAMALALVTAKTAEHVYVKQDNNRKVLLSQQKPKKATFAQI